MSTPPLRLMIAEDHALVRDGLRAWLETQPDFDLVGEAADGHEAIRIGLALQPDVALIDLLLPGVDGVAVCRALSLGSPATRLVVLTSSEEEAPVIEAMKAGALGYLSKAMGAAELLQAVREAAAGETVLSARAKAALTRPLRNPQALPVLSPREQDVLTLLAEGLSNVDIGRRLGIGESTVKTHVSNVLAKLGVSDRTQAAVQAWRQGLVSARWSRA
ncbi:MAG: response regulator transcription factor [Xanthomonadales bacterium]|jgi:NarL family two-component system response regulator LiaR|nr:response regulator transcription factor [Xanthomonadales bacterium]